MKAEEVRQIAMYGIDGAFDDLLCTDLWWTLELPDRPLTKDEIEAVRADLRAILEALKTSPRLLPAPVQPVWTPAYAQKGTA